MKNKANLKALKRLISISISTSTSKSQSLNKANKAKTPQPQPQLRLIRRLQILVLLTCHFHKKAISMMLGCDIKTVDNLRKRFAAGEGIVDRHRSGRPPTISSDVTLRLIALYCQQNPLPGCNRWSINWLAKYVKKHPEILKLKSTICISRSSIYRRLKAHALRPYRIKYFLQISDSQFFEKMEKIIQVYAACYKYLFCIDECTVIQVLERIDPDLPQQGKHPEYKDSHYIRHGTVSIFSFLEVSTGRVFTECIPDHKSSTVIMAIRKHISQYDCNETIHYILDNYSSHSTEEFCREIAKLKYGVRLFICLRCCLPWEHCCMQSGIRYDKQVRLDRNLNIYLALGTGHLGIYWALWARDTGHATQVNCGIAESIYEKE